MKKKFLAVILAVSMVISMTGCGVVSVVKATRDALDNAIEEVTDESVSDGVNTDEVGFEKEEDSADIEDFENEELGENQVDDSEGNDADTQIDQHMEDMGDFGIDESVDYIDYSFDYQFDSKDTVMDGNYVCLSTMNYNLINIDSQGYDELKAAILNYNEQLADSAQTYYQEFSEWAKADAERIYEYGYDARYFVDYSENVIRADSDYFTILSSYSSYTGGAHGDYGVGGYNFDSKTGRELTQEDVFADGETAAYAVAQSILETHDSGEFFYITSSEDSNMTDVEKLAAGLYENYFAPEHEYNLNFLLQNESVAIYFVPYEIAPYAAGIVKAEIAYDETAGILNQDLHLKTNSYLEPFDQATSFGGIAEHSITTDDGYIRNLAVSADWQYDENDYSFSWIDKIIVTLDDESVETETYGYSFETYMLKDDGRNFVIVDVLSDDDTHSLCIYEVVGTTLKQVDDVSGRLGEGRNPGKFTITDRIDLLSTYSGSIGCRMAEDGRVEPIDSFYTIRSIDFPLVSTRELEVYLVDKDTLEDISIMKCPKGTKFEFRYTGGMYGGNDNWVVFELGDGSLVKLYVDYANGEMTINGVNEFNCFEVLYYAG